jgi:tartrate-resistant acid phosphatase type 5
VTVDVTPDGAPRASRLAVRVAALTVVMVVGPFALTDAPSAWSQLGAATDDAATAPPQGDLAALERSYRAERSDKVRARVVLDMAGLPGAAPLLAQIVETDPSDDVALAAAYALRRTTLGALVGSLERRLKTGTRDATARDRLAREIERHQIFAAGQNVPHFLRDAPPVFSLGMEKRPSVRILAFGDFGNGSPRQEHMAESMRRAHADKPFDLAVTLGDNFYPAGMSGPTDPRWQRDFARLYEPMRIPFYPSLGNHDWILADSPAAEILHSAKSDYWRMPALRYSFVAGPVQLFAIDTNLVSRAELDWLDRELARSTARWKIVYGHHPIFSNGAHGEDPTVRDNVLPLLRGRASVYLCGHEHDLQHLGPEGGVHFVIVGGGGTTPRPTRAGPRSLFAASKNGFAVIDASKTSLTVTFVGEDLKPLHRFSIGE